MVELGTQAEVAALFPKSYPVGATTLSRESLRSLLDIPAGLTVSQLIKHPSYGNEVVGLLTIRAGLSADRVNGGINEAGIERAKAFLAKAEKLGFKVCWNEP